MKIFTALVFIFLSIYDAKNICYNGIKIEGDWCSDYQNDTLILTRNSSILQCSGMTFNSDGTMSEYIAPNIFSVWNKRAIGYDILDSTICFRRIDHENMYDTVEYKIVEYSPDKLILTLINSH